MNRHSTILLTALLVLAPAVAAQESAAAESADPGWVAADSPLYRAELAVDNALVQVNLQSPGDVVVERAAEARDAVERNASAAQSRAMTALQDSAAQADGLRDEDALQQAEQILEGVQERVPDAAQAGIATALDSVIAAKNRFPTDETPAQKQENGSPAGGLFGGAA